MNSDPVSTYQTSFSLTGESKEIFEKMAAYFCHVERALFADYARGKKISVLKNEYVSKYQITARHFNAIRIVLEGKIDSFKKLRDLRIQTLEEKQGKVQKTLSRLEKSSKEKLSSKDKKKLITKKKESKKLEEQLSALKKDREEGTVRLCFGSKKLFRAQFELEKNGYKSLEEWKTDWTKKRNSTFFFVGSKDETAGNQSCKATIASDDSISLWIRLPRFLEAQHGKYLEIPYLKFAYGHEVILKSLASCLDRAKYKKPKEPSSYGTAISYRFQLGEKGQCYVYATTSFTPPKITTTEKLGVIGLDINSDHIALAETDHFGNIIYSESFPLVTYGKSSEQSTALIGDVIAKIVHLAKSSGKTIVCEDLDFEKKKKGLKEIFSKKHRRMISSFSYHKILDMLKSRSIRFGVELVSVNPAYTSVIGRVKYATRYGISIHVAAAFAIARRYLKVFEKTPCKKVSVPDSKGGHMIFSPPARNSGADFWSSWKSLNKKLLAELAAHFRATREVDPKRHHTVYV